MQISLMSMETRRSARKKMRLEHGMYLVSEDRLSNLPVHIIHDIISRLPSKNAAWMSTLSKKWTYLLQSFPVLGFDEHEFEYKNETKNDRRLRQFMSKYSLCQAPIPIQKIRIGTSPVRCRRIDRQVDRCLDLVPLTELGELSLLFRHSHRWGQAKCLCYSIPSKVFSLGTQLTVLELEGCRFGNLEAVYVPLLKIVSKRYVHISDNIFFKMFVACPKLESLVLQHCRGLRRLRVINPSLQRLAVSYCRGLESFYIDCPLLQYLECKAREVHEPESNLEFLEFWTSCFALRGIYFERVNLGAETFEHIILTSPHIKSLTMNSCEVEGTLNDLPKELKHLDMEDTYIPELVEGLPSVESLSFGNKVNSYWAQPRNVYADFKILSSALISFAHLTSLLLQGDHPPSDGSLQFVISIYLIFRF